MRSGTCIAALLLLVGSYPAPPPVRAVAACVLCGHECCCPEVCARELKSRAAASDCNQPAAVCKIDASPPAGLVHQAAEARLWQPSSGDLPLSSSSDGAGRLRRKRDASPPSAAPTLDIPTPPPRLA